MLCVSLRTGTPFLFMINKTMNRINLEELGTSFTVFNRQTNETTHIRVIEYADLKTAIGEYIGSDYKNIKVHIEAILRRCVGFVKSPYDVTWYAARKDEFELAEAIMQADAEQNKIVVVEVLPEPEEELDTNFRIK